MIELRATPDSHDLTIVDIRCPAGVPQELFMRFVRAKVSIENLLPAGSILRTSRDTGDAETSLSWRVRGSAVKAHLAFARTAFELMNVPYQYKSGRKRTRITGVGRCALPGKINHKG